MCLVIDVLILLAIASVVASMFMRTPKEHYDLDRHAYPVKGIDVSAHNGDIDFDSVAVDTVSFVYIKVTEGTDFCDANFNINYHNAKGAGLMVGPYHFFRFDSPAELQAEHLINSCHGHTFDLPIAIDVEEWGNPDTYDTDTIKARLNTMVDLVLNAGYPVILYTNKRGYRSYIKGGFDGIPLWLCALSATEPNNATLWQHSHRSFVKGIRGPVDQNTYCGSVDDFRQFAKPYTVGQGVIQPGHH